jgi:hypothetical protein
MPGPCNYVKVYDAYICRQGYTDPISWLGVNNWSPTPRPSTGILGEPTVLVLESVDADKETRNFSPVTFTIGKVSDLVLAAAPHQWCNTYWCPKRLAAV